MKKLLTLFTLLLCVCSGAWGTPKTWNFQTLTGFNNSENDPTEFHAEGSNWTYSSNIYTYNVNSNLENYTLLNQNGDNLSYTDGLTFTIPAKKKVQIGKGYLFINNNTATVNIPTTAGEYVNLLVGISSANKSFGVSGGEEITSFSVPFSSGMYSINIKATGTKVSISTTDAKMTIYQIAVINASDVVQAPTFNYSTGSYYKGVSISLSANTAGSTVKFKTDSSPKAIGAMGNYSEAQSLTSNKTICAVAEKDGLYSDYAYNAYTIVSSYPTPIAAPAAGIYSSAQSVTFSSKGTSGEGEVDILPNGVIYYTLDGSTPNNSNTRYDGTPINITETKTLKAILYSDGTTNKSSVLEALYEIVVASDPEFSLSATTIPSNSTAQIKVGDNDGLDGVTLSNIAYGTDGIVTVNATTGVVTPVTAGTTTITFDTDATVKYNSSTGNEFTITVTTPKCATPTITVGAFNFANKGYKVTITNNEDGSTLYYSTNNVDWTEYTSALYATTTTNYYAKSVKASYDDSEVANENVTNTFDGEKKYIAWVYKDGYTSADVAYDFDTDPMVIGLKTTYNVVPVALDDSDKPYTNRATDGIAIDKANLVVCTEAVTGNTNLANDMKNFVGRNTMINLKLWNYGGNQTRWGWGTPANNTSSFTFTPTSTLYKVLNGVTFEDGAVKVFESTAPKNNKLAYVTWSNEPTNNVNMGSVSGKTTMHAIIDNNNLDKQFFAFGLSRDNATSYTANAVTIIKNAAAMLIAGTERLDAEVATVPVTIGASGYASYCSSYALDFTETGVTAYTAKVEEEKVVLTKVTDNIVPANEGVVLRGAQNDYNIPVATTDDSFDFSENQMVGVVQRTQVVWNPSTDVYNYILQQGQFNKATDGYLKANRAYLSTTYNVDAPGAKPLTIVFNDEEQGEETDGIKSVQGSGFTVNGEAYNLSGQRVGADYKGLVIINGKKVIRK